jgi:hypothetical protein
MQATQLIQGGLADCTLALGFEKMQPGSLGSYFDDRTNPLDKHATGMIEKAGFAPAPMAAQFFGNAGKGGLLFLQYFVQILRRLNFAMKKFIFMDFIHFMINFDI